MDDKQLQVLIGMFNQITSKIDHLEEIVSKRNDDVFTKMDAVYGEVISVRQEQVAHQLSHNRIDEVIEDIKSVPVIAHELRKKG